MYSTLLPFRSCCYAGRLEEHGGGLVLAAMSVGMVVFSPSVVACRRSGRRAPTVAGLSLLTLGLVRWHSVERDHDPALLAAWGDRSRYRLSSAGLQTAAIEAVGPRESGVRPGSSRRAAIWQHRRVQRAGWAARADSDGSPLWRGLPDGRCGALLSVLVSVGLHAKGN